MLTKRLFWAVRLSDLVHDKVQGAVAKMQAVAAERYVHSPVQIDWVPSERFHITLQYLGPTEESKISEIESVGRKICADFSKFEVSARGFGVFPNDTHPKVIWARVIDSSEETLQKLADRFWNEMRAFANKPENYPFKAHLTVGRVRQARGVGEILFPIKALSLGTSEVREVILYESIVDENGRTLEYREISKIELS